MEITKKTRASKPKVDLTGKKFGSLTPFEYVKGGKWKCKCDCGNETMVDTRNLNSGHTKSCGCLLKKVNSEKNTYDMSNYESDTIRVLKRAGSDSGGIALWECLCKICGNIFVARGSNIRNGDTRTCGCVHSLNERKIIGMLTEANVEFATQFTFPDLTGTKGGRLRFDFAIFKEGRLSHLIEYNGIQHYRRADGKWGEGYLDLIENDKTKQQYCEKLGIPLIIIRYDTNYTLKDLLL